MKEIPSPSRFPTTPFALSKRTPSVGGACSCTNPESWSKSVGFPTSTHLSLPHAPPGSCQLPERSRRHFISAWVRLFPTPHVCNFYCIRSSKKCPPLVLSSGPASVPTSCDY